jgi:hypothetical protein
MTLDVVCAFGEQGLLESIRFRVGCGVVERSYKRRFPSGMTET